MEQARADGRKHTRVCSRMYKISSFQFELLRRSHYINPAIILGRLMVVTGHLLGWGAYVVVNMKAKVYIINQMVSLP